VLTEILRKSLAPAYIIVFINHDAFLIVYH